MSRLSYLAFLGPRQQWCCILNSPQPTPSYSKWKKILGDACHISRACRQSLRTCIVSSIPLPHLWQIAVSNIPLLHLTQFFKILLWVDCQRNILTRCATWRHHISNPCLLPTVMHSEWSSSTGRLEIWNKGTSSSHTLYQNDISLLFPNLHLTSNLNNSAPHTTPLQVLESLWLVLNSTFAFPQLPYFILNTLHQVSPSFVSTFHAKTELYSSELSSSTQLPPFLWVYTKYPNLTNEFLAADPSLPRHNCELCDQYPFVS